MRRNAALIFLFGYSAFFFQNLFTLYFNYTNNNVSNLFLSVGFYLSMSIGAFCVHRRSSDVPLPTLHLINAANFLVAFVILAWLPSFSLFALILALIGVGASQSLVFRQAEFRATIISLSAGAIVYFGTAKWIFDIAGPWLVCICIILPACAVVLQKRTKTLDAGFVSVVAAALVLQFCGVFSPPSWQEANRFKDFNPQKLATIYTPTIISDVIQARGPHYIITNGSRFSRIFDKEIRESYRESPLYDAPYVLEKPKKVLIIGPAGGLNVFRALENKVEEIYAVDINPAVAEFGARSFSSVNEGIYLRRGLHLITAEGRGFVESTQEKFDLIVVQGVQTGTMASVSANALMESFLFTNESVRAMLRVLNQDGMIFFEEDSVWSRRELTHDSSVLKNLQFSLLNSGIVTSESSLLFGYTMAPQFPGLHNAEPIRREVLMVGLHDAALAADKLRANFGEFQLNFLDVSRRTDLLKMTDDRPYLVSQEFGGFEIPLTVAFLLLSVGLVYYSLRVAKKMRLPRMQSGSMFLAGASYTLMLVSLAGPMYLLSGNPNAAVLLVNLALVVSSLILAFVRFYEPSRRFFLICSSYVLILILFYFFKDELVYSTITRSGYASRLSIAVTIAVFLFLFVEAPYYAVLAIRPAADRPALMLFGKLGALSGVVLGLLCQLQYGFVESMLACLLCYAGSLLMLFISKRIDPT